MNQNPGAEFQALRQRYIKRSLRIGAFGVLCFASMAVLLALEYDERFALIPFAGFFLAIVLWVVQTFLLYRCPSCKTVPMVKTGGGWQVDFTPAQCRKCGAPLREGTQT